MTAMPEMETPGPIPDEVDFENLLRKQLIDQARTTLEAMVSALKSGHDPVRSLHLIETYAASLKMHISELGDSEDFLDRDPHYGVNPVGPGVMRRGGALNMGFPVHGGEARMVQEVVGMVEGLMTGMNKQRSEADRTRQIRDLTEAVATAKEMRDKDLEARMREELGQILERLVAPRPVDANDNDDNVIDASFTRDVDEGEGDE